MSSINSTMVVCRFCRHVMLQTTTPGGEACIECTNPMCQWCIHADFIDTLERVAAVDAAPLLRLFGYSPSALAA